MTEFHLGVNNCFAVKRWPLAENWAETCAKDLGLTSVQFSFDLVDPRASEPALSSMIEETTQACRKCGVSIHSSFTGLAAYSFNLLTHPSLWMRLDALDWFHKAIEATRRLGARMTGGHIAALSYPDYTAGGDRRGYLEGFLIDSMKSLSKTAAASGLEMLLWEPMPLLREPPCRIADAERLLEEANRDSAIPVGLAIDTGHQCTWGVGGEDLDTYAWLQRLGRRSPVVHIQQTDGKGDRHWPFTKKYNDIGVIRPQKVIDAIEGSGAKEVYLMLEIIHPFETPEKQVLTELKESAVYWSDFL